MSSTVIQTGFGEGPAHTRKKTGKARESYAEYKREKGIIQMKPEMKRREGVQTGSTQTGQRDY